MVGMDALRAWVALREARCAGAFRAAFRAAFALVLLILIVEDRQRFVVFFRIIGDVKFVA